MIPILKLIWTLGQAILPLLNFEMVGFATFAIAMLQNTLNGIWRNAEISETPLQSK